MSPRTKKILAAIGGAVVVIAIAIAVISLIQGKNRNEAIRQQTEQRAQQAEDEKAAREAEQAAREAEREAEKAEAEAERKKLQEIADAIKGPQREDPSGCRHISWSDTEKAWETMPMSKEEILYLAKHSNFGSPVYIKGKVTEVVGTLIIHDIYSTAQTQTVVWLKYKIDEDTEILRTILLKGEYSCEDIDDLPGGLNWQKTCCTTCIQYGGNFYDTPQKVGYIKDPCQGRQRNSNCQECGAGEKQGDGAVPEKGTDSYAPKTRRSGKW